MRLRLRLALALNWIEWKLARLSDWFERNYLSESERDVLMDVRIDQHNAWATEVDAREAAKEV